jgi:hypothetical protein
MAKVELKIVEKIAINFEAKFKVVGCCKSFDRLGSVGRISAAGSRRAG